MLTPSPQPSPPTIRGGESTRAAGERGLQPWIRVLRLSLLISITAFFAFFGDTRPLRADDAEKVHSVQEFLALKKKWPNYAAIKVAMTIEGRLAGFSTRTMRLSKFPPQLLAMPGKRLPVFPKSTRHVQVTGHLEKRKQSWVIVVHSAKEYPTDTKTIADRMLKLPAENAKPWYTLSQWIFNRATFYEDAKLKERGRTVLLQAVRIERSQLKPDDDAGRLRLAKKVDDLSLSPSLSGDLKHAAHRGRWRRYLAAGKPALHQVVEAMKRDLPGFDKPLKNVPTKLWATYKKSPQAVYEKSDQQTRRTLHRLTYLDTVLHQITPTIKPDGSNGDAVAARIEKLAPELKAMAAMHRERDLQYRISRINRLRRADALALVQVVRKRKSDKAAHALIKSWLLQRNAEVKRATLPELIQLADDYQLFLKDRKRAIALLKLAHRRDPESKFAHKRMLAFGLVFNEGKWVEQGDVKPRPIDPVERAIREGRPLKGMSPAQVKRAMGSAAPASIVRVASRRKINEVWIFRLPNNTRVAVHFERLRTQTRRDSKVVAVSNSR